MKSRDTKNCTKCGGPSKLVKFTSFEYLYCTTCKEEVLDAHKDDVWIREGEICYCQACGDNLLEATEDILISYKSLGMNLSPKFKRLQAKATGDLFGCKTCMSAWNPFMSASYTGGCYTWDHDKNERKLLVRFRGWI